MTKASARRLLGILITGAPFGLTAQGRLDISTGEVQFRGQSPMAALTLAPQYGMTAAGLAVWSDGVLSLSNAAGTRTSIRSTVSTARPLFFGLSPVVQLRGQSDPIVRNVSNRRIDGALGVSVGSAQLGASAGVGLAQSVHGTTNRSVQTSNVDVHVARRSFQFRVGYVGQTFDVPTAMPGTQGGFSLVRNRLSDFTSDASWRVRGMELGAFVGRRVGGSSDGRNWGGAFATLAVTDRVAIVARHETAPPDPTRHLASQQRSTIGFRIRPSLSRARFEDGSDAGQYRHEFVLTRVAGSTHGIRVYLPDASAVDVTGSFSDWSPVAMHRTSGGWWEVSLPLQPGLHTLNFRADGGAWTVPPGIQTVSDDFNGKVGVLVIPE